MESLNHVLIGDTIYRCYNFTSISEFDVIIAMKYDPLVNQNQAEFITCFLSETSDFFNVLTRLKEIESFSCFSIIRFTSAHDANSFIQKLNYEKEKENILMFPKAS